MRVRRGRDFGANLPLQAREGRRDPPASGGAWFRAAGLAGRRTRARRPRHPHPSLLPSREKGSVGFAQRAWLVAGRGLGARDTLILAFHEGRRDPPASGGDWLRAAGLVAAGRGLGARDTLILAFSREGKRDPPASAALGFARRAWLVAGRGLGARDTLILAFSRQGRRDAPASGGAWFRAAGLAGRRTRDRRPRHPHPNLLP